MREIASAFCVNYSLEYVGNGFIRSAECINAFPTGKGERYMKATGIVRRVDDLGRIVIPKEIRRTLRIREGDPSCTTLISSDLFIRGILAFGDRVLGSKH